MIQPISTQDNLISNVNKRINSHIEFDKILKSKEVELKISSHAANRLKERDIKLSENDLSKIKTAVEDIRVKGGREALILYNNVAYITSVKNNTVITAIDSENLKNNVFTNIDSTIILLAGL